MIKEINIKENAYIITFKDEQVNDNKYCAAIVKHAGRRLKILNFLNEKPFSITTQ